MTPLFSVVVACYNHEKFVKEAIDSALCQSYADREVIAVDDGSSDGTVEILETFGDSIVLVKLPENGGVANARNQGAARARGRYLAFLDGDDVLMPWALDVYHRLIAAQEPKIILAKCSKCTHTVPAVETMRAPDAIEYVPYEDFLSKDRPWVYNTSALIVDRAVFEAGGGWSADIFYQDIQDLLSKLGTTGKTLLVLAPATVWYRMHAANAVLSILPFVNGIYRLLAKARANAYPGGRKANLHRQAWYGGLIFYWAKEALRAGLYREGCGLLARHGWLVAWAMARRGTARMAGRRSVETLRMEPML